MKIKKNKDLASYYNFVYKKGEQKHYSRYRIKASSEFDHVIKCISWKGKKVLDVGCGTGLFDYRIAKKGATVLAIDYATKAIDVARELYHAPRLKFEVGTASTIVGTYDVIISMGTLEHTDNPLAVLKKFKKHLNPKGYIVISGPNWTNMRGNILMTLKLLFNAPITLADVHYLTPIDFEYWAKKLNMNLSWKTFDQSWGCGEVMLTDLEKRLPNVFRDAKLAVSSKSISALLQWFKNKAIPLESPTKHSGATAAYVFKAKK